MLSLIKVEKVLIKNKKKLLEKSKIAVGIGYKTVSGKQTGELAIIGSVEKKLPKSKLAEKDLIPEMVSGIPTDIIETGIIKALHTNRHRPALGGVSIGHVNISCGSLGCIVKKDGTRCILSNNHVLACSNDAERGDAIIQPGAHDKGIFPDDHIAELFDFVPINFTGIPSECPVSGAFIAVINGLLHLTRSKTRLQSVIQAEANLVDAAIARPLKNEDVSDEIMEIGKVEGMKSAILGMKIQKSGRTTGLTTGEVTQVDVTVNVQYGEGKLASFSDQIMSGKMCEGGDSGSAVLDMDGYLCGLLFGGSDTSMVANRIENVFELLNIHL